MPAVSADANPESHGGGFQDISPPARAPVAPSKARKPKEAQNSPVRHGNRHDEDHEQWAKAIPTEKGRGGGRSRSMAKNIWVCRLGNGWPSAMSGRDTAMSAVPRMGLSRPKLRAGPVKS